MGSDPVSIGPIKLAPGVTRFNFWTFMYASFICIGMLAGMNFYVQGIDDKLPE